jgi:hypothetical protein
MRDTADKPGLKLRKAFNTEDAESTEKRGT